VSAVAIVLALLSALAYGTSDFVSGVLSNRTSSWSVGFAGQLVGGTGIAVVALAQGDPAPSPSGWLWAVVAGLGTGLGVAFLYRGFTAGRMGVVAPISGVGAAVVPVVVGLLTGDRPGALAWLGIVLALPAIYLVARTPTSGGGRDGVLEGILAGLGFGTSFAALGQIHASEGLWPVAANEYVGALTLVVAASIARAAWVPRSRTVAWTLVTGLLAATAMVAFVLSTHHGMLTVSAIISSLYPAATVVLAIAVLRERVHRAQGVGLALCALAVTLVAS